MSAQHTPAPWLITGEDKSFVYALGPKNTNRFWVNVQAAGPEAIGQEEKEANARLIAAAPDLLAALKAVVEFYSYAELGPIDDARKAIAKATGAE